MAKNAIRKPIRIEGKTFRYLVTAAALVIVIAGMREAKPILVPVLLSVFIAIISSPALFWLESKKVPRILAFLIVCGVVIGALLIVASIVTASLNDFMTNLPNYKAQLEIMTKAAFNLAGKYKIPINTNKTQIMQHIDPSMIRGIAGNMLNNAGMLISNALLIFLTVGFILFESSSFPTKMEKITELRGDPVIPSSRYIDDLKRYLAIKTLTSFATGLTIFLILKWFRIDYPFLWGFLAFFLNFIPSIGSIIAAIPALLLCLIQYGVVLTIWLAILYFIINNVISNVIEPKFMGNKLGLSPLIVFLSLLFWGWVLGPVGMFLSVPLTMAAKIIFDSDEDTKWIGVILGP